jgi:hypothetical protein
MARDPDPSHNLIQEMYTFDFEPLILKAKLFGVHQQEC